MKKLLPVLLLACSANAFAQTVFYNQDFEGTHNWTLNVSTGSEGTDPNFFTVSDNEGGVAAGGCGIASNGNKTLHVTSVFMPTAGASYDAGGLCGILFCPQTDRRAESPTIDCSGRTNITLSFDFISVGEGLNDNASVYYYNGTTWSVLENSIKATVCGNGQGLWTAHSVALPASANNNPNVKIAFRWVNNDDGVGSDPSFAVNDVKLSVPAGLSASLSSSTNILCNGGNTGSATVAAAGGTAPYTYLWNNGATTATISNVPAGTYSCTITDNTGATATQTVVLTEPSAIVTNQNISLCAGESLTVGNNTYTTSGTYSDVLQAANGCDSTVNTSLQIAPPVNVATAITGPTITAGLVGAQYQWIDCANNTIIAGATNQSYTATNSGSYAVIITVGNCSDTSVCSTVSFAGLNETIGTIVPIYPNPSSEKLFVELSTISTILIYNAQGALVMETIGQIGVNEIQTKNLAGGHYTLIASSKDGNSKPTSFVVLK